jgi:hypothetical protein
LQRYRKAGFQFRLLQSIPGEEKAMPKHLIAVCLPGATILCGVCAETEEHAREIAEDEIKSRIKGI